MRRRWQRRQSSTASTCCAPTASCPPSKWPCATASCGRWSRSSAPPRPCWKRGRSITPATPLSAATCSPPSWRWCCARYCRTGCRQLNWISSGRTSSPTSTASSRPPLSSMDVASCCAIRRQAVPERCSRPLVSPCRRCSDVWTQKIPPHPPARPARNPASAASHPGNVVPRPPRKNESANQISKFQKHGVEVELDEPVRRERACSACIVFLGHDHGLGIGRLRNRQGGQEQHLEQS